MLLEYSDVWPRLVKLGVKVKTSSSAFACKPSCWKKDIVACRHVFVQLRLGLRIVWQLCTVVLAWRGQVVVMLGLTEGRQK